MSPHAANSLVHDLVQMAQAFERLPGVELDLMNAQVEIDRKSETIQRLEMRIMDLKSEVEQANADKRSLEVARDDAELRFLEAEDRTEKALAFVRSMFGNAGALIQALEPVRQEPKPEPFEPMPPTYAGEEALPLANSIGQSVTTSAPSSEYASDGTITPGEQHLDVAADAGQSEPGPTASSQESGMSTAMHEGLLQTAETTNVLSLTDALFTVSEAVSVGPYTNKRYIDYPGIVSRKDWLAGGGTDADYDYRG